jgi:hypothetical protein
VRSKREGALAMRALSLGKSKSSIDAPTALEFAVTTPILVANDGAPRVLKLVMTPDINVGPAAHGIRDQ